MTFTMAKIGDPVDVKTLKFFDVEEPAILTDRLYSVAPADEPEYPIAIFDLDMVEDHGIKGWCHSISSWTEDESGALPDIVGADSDGVFSIFCKWDGCSHIGTSGYRHLCGLTHAKHDYQRIEAAYVLTGLLSATYFCGDEMPMEVVRQPNFRERQYTSKLGGTMLLRRITTADIWGGEEALAQAREERGKE